MQNLLICEPNACWRRTASPRIIAASAGPQSPSGIVDASATMTMGLRSISSKDTTQPQQVSRQDSPTSWRTFDPLWRPGNGDKGRSFPCSRNLLQIEMSESNNPPWPTLRTRALPPRSEREKHRSAPRVYGGQSHRNGTRGFIPSTIFHLRKRLGPISGGGLSGCLTPDINRGLPLPASASCPPSSPR